MNEWLVNEWNIGLGSAQWGQFHPFEIHYSLCKLAQYFSRFCVLGVPLGCPGSWISFAEILVEHYLRQSAGRSTTRWVVLKLVTTELLMCIGGAASDIKLLALWTEKFCTCKLPTFAYCVPSAVSFPIIENSHVFIHSLIHENSISWIAMNSDASCALHKSSSPVRKCLLWVGPRWPSHSSFLYGAHCLVVKKMTEITQCENCHGRGALGGLYQAAGTVWLAGHCCMSKTFPHLLCSQSITLC